MKEQYHLLCKTENSIPIFSQDWWLDIVCGKEKWEVLLIKEKGCIKAALPLYIPCRGIISMPPLTQTMGSEAEAVTSALPIDHIVRLG